MCFSAEASFTAAGVTSVAGVVAVRSAPRRSYLLLAVIPLLFAVHQLSEGVVWLSLGGRADPDWARPAMFAFLAFAEVLWPAWVPLAVLAVEKDPPRRKVLTGLFGLGLALSVAHVYGLIAYPVSGVIFGNHIKYHLDTPWLYRWVTDIAYTLTTILPPLVSRDRTIRWIGVLILASAVLSKIIFLDTFISTWCFFAAFISALVVVHLKRSGRAGGSSRDGIEPDLDGSAS